MNPDRRSVSQTIHDSTVTQVVPSDDALFYLSFVDVDDSGDRWLGGCFVTASSPVAAVATAHHLGCNPGGEVAIWGPFGQGAVRPEFKNKLLDKEQLQEAGA